MSDYDIPPGYRYEPSVSAFINHIGRVFIRRLEGGTEDEVWVAIRIGSHHVNSWGLAHGALIASMAECATGLSGWDPAGPPSVAIDLSVQFIAAPKLGELLEVRGVVTKRSRTLVFTRCEGSVAGKPVFAASSIQKIVEK